MNTEKRGESQLPGSTQAVFRERPGLYKKGGHKKPTTQESNLRDAQLNSYKRTLLQLNGDSQIIMREITECPLSIRIAALQSLEP